MQQLSKWQCKEGRGFGKYSLAPNSVPGWSPRWSHQQQSVAQACQYQTFTCLLSCLIIGQSLPCPCQLKASSKSVPPTQPGFSLSRTAPSLVAQLLSDCRRGGAILRSPTDAPAVSISRTTQYGTCPARPPHRTVEFASPRWAATLLPYSWTLLPICATLATLATMCSSLIRDALRRMFSLQCNLQL